jgi:hypothetical protein
MPRDYRAVVEALRAKAADPSCTPEESSALTEKADVLAKKYNVTELVTGPEVLNWAKHHADWPTAHHTTYAAQYGWPAKDPVVVFFSNGNDFWHEWLVDLDEDPKEYDWGVDPQ